MTAKRQRAVEESDPVTISADIDLCAMDAIYGRGNDVTVECAKAVTVAQTNAGVEAKIVVYNARDFARAADVMSGKGATMLGFRFRETTNAFELPNGSCVTIYYRSKP
jgi:hypothetical protein